MQILSTQSEPGLSPRSCQRDIQFRRRLLVSELPNYQADAARFPSPRNVTRARKQAVCMAFSCELMFGSTI